jgi:hypothetical protein
MPVNDPTKHAYLPKSRTLPKQTSTLKEYTGTLEVLESFNNKSEVNESDFINELTPDRAFVEVVDAINKDPRLDLSRETYVQMIMGKGFKVKFKKDKHQKIYDNWAEEIGFDTLIEDGLYSYTGTGNMIFEVSPRYDDLIEVDITTMETVVRKRNGQIKAYKQRVNDRDIFFKPSEIEHFKLSNINREVWGRGLFHSVLHTYRDPRTDEVYDSTLVQMKKMEAAMPEIFHSYASPLAMFHFEDAGEDFIKNQADALKKAKAGMKIVTDKKFDVEMIQAKTNGDFGAYIEHMQRDLVEPGSKFPLQFFNAGFTARAASESTDSVLIRKVRSIQRRLAKEIKQKLIYKYFKLRHGIILKSEDCIAQFERDHKNDLSIDQVITSFRDNITRRSEARQYFIENTNFDLDPTDMEDEPPITSVTPTGQLRDQRSGQFGGPVDGDTEEEPELRRPEPVTKRLGEKYKGKRKK